MDGPLSVQIPVQLLLELEPNLLVQNVIELEFELSSMQMKQSFVDRPSRVTNYYYNFAGPLCVSN